MSYSKKCPGCVRQTETLGRIIDQRNKLRADRDRLAAKLRATQEALGELMVPECECGCGCLNEAHVVYTDGVGCKRLLCDACAKTWAAGDAEDNEDSSHDCGTDYPGVSELIGGES